MEIKPEYTLDGSPLVLVQLVLGTRPQKDGSGIGVRSRTSAGML